MYNGQMHVNSNTRLILNNLTTAIMMLDEQLRVVYANHSAQVLMQVSHSQLTTVPLTELLIHGSLDQARLQETRIHGEGYSDSEVQLLFHDGRNSLADVSVTPISHASSAHLLIELKIIEQQKRISQESLHWAQQQAARELIRGLAHEIKNPLGGIRGAAQLLEKRIRNEAVKEYTSMIIEQSDRLRNLVDRLLGPNSPPDFNVHNVHRILEKIRTLANFDESHQITIARDYDPSIPEFLLDEAMLQQALLNIVRNSMQALRDKNGKGQITLQTRIDRQLTIHGQRHPLVAKIKVIDDGPGIPDHLKDTLFYPMVTGKQDGTGLGLSIAQTLIDHHRGKIEVESWPGHTEFTLYLPIDERKSNR